MGFFFSKNSAFIPNSSSSSSASAKPTNIDLSDFLLASTSLRHFWSFAWVVNSLPSTKCFN